MPRISEFFGVVIYMCFNDHPPAHFHAECGDFEAVYTIDTMEISYAVNCHDAPISWSSSGRWLIVMN